MKLLAILLAGLTLTGCATLPPGKPDPRDPWERMNRSTHAFNDAIDKSIGKPAAKAYVKVTPRFVRTGISNVLNNLDTLNTILNDVLQGKMHQAGNDSARFVINSTFGIAGIFNPASKVGLEFNDEDFGQTFGKWGLKPGPYVVLPFFGPSTTRDTFTRLMDQYTYPVTYLGDESTRYIIRVVSLLDTRAGLLDLDEQIDRSYDRYAFIRNAWLQRREFQVTDGNVEDPSLELEQDIEQDMESEPAPAPDEPAPEQPPQQQTEGAAPADAAPAEAARPDAASPEAAPDAATPADSPAAPPAPQGEPAAAVPRS